MKHYLLFIYIYFLPCCILYAQEKVLKGRLTDENGEPIPGVSVIVKGTNRGTITDAQGYYTITAPIGSTLVLSAVGFATQEIRVAGKPSPAVNNNSKLLQESKDSIAFDYSKYFEKKDSLLKSSKRVAFLDDASPTYRYKFESSQRNIPVIYKIRKRRNQYILDTNQPYQNYYRKSKLSLDFQTAFSTQAINRLPALQNRYAQGSPQNGETIWRGAETGELFSWGPALANLEYTGNEYAYDSKGTLTNLGNGNGKIAQAYNPLDFLRNAYHWSNHIQLSKGFKNNRLVAQMNYNRQNYVIPESNAQQISANLNHQISIGGLNLNTILNYQNDAYHLPQIGANWQTILGSLYRTPPSFDNANGLKRKDAIGNTNVFQLSDGTPRNHSPYQVDNPFGLVSNIPDELNNKGFNAQFKATYKTNDFDFNYNLGFERQIQDKQFGLLPQSAVAASGRFTDRNLEAYNFFLRANNEWIFFKAKNYSWRNRNRLSLLLEYQYQYEHQNLQRLDAFDFPSIAGLDLSQATLINHIDFDKARNTHQVFSKVKWEGFGNVVTAYIGNQTYFSSTLHKKDFKYFLPQISTKLRIKELIPDDLYALQSFNISFAYSSSVQEAPLIYNQWQFNSTNLSSANYAQYYEANEILLQDNLQPERHRKLDIGFELGLQFGLSGGLNYFSNRTLAMLVPVSQGNQFVLQNLADLHNQGWEAHLEFYSSRWSAILWESRLNFSRYNPIITRLRNFNRVPLAGYTDISSNMMENQPMGVLIGTKYQRNENDQIVIDDSGYPLVNPTPQILGNPNPDFTFAWYNLLRFKALSLSFTLEYQQGGILWNGTNNALNYLGTSQVSAEQRKVTGFVFEGVRTDGTPNQQAVDFANPTNGLNGNRWARYGWSGVAEESIEKASWIRFNQIKITYDFTNFLKKLYFNQQGNISFYIKNLLLYAPYSGIDPNATLMNYKQGMGLDLFNHPNTISYGLQLELKF